jgi:hypothetical protein
MAMAACVALVLSSPASAVEVPRFDLRTTGDS